MFTRLFSSVLANRVIARRFGQQPTVAFFGLS